MSQSGATGQAIFLGNRSLTENGDSISVSLPKREIRDELGIDLDEHSSETVRVKVFDDGSARIELSCLESDPDRRLKTAVDAD